MVRGFLGEIIGHAVLFGAGVLPSIVYNMRCHRALLLAKEEPLRNGVTCSQGPDSSVNTYNVSLQSVDRYSVEFVTRRSAHSIDFAGIPMIFGNKNRL